jgi:hypothetical protein
MVLRRAFCSASRSALIGEPLLVVRPVGVDQVDFGVASATQIDAQNHWGKDHAGNFVIIVQVNRL